MEILITENQMNEIEEYIYDDLDYLYPIDDITYGSAEEYDSETGEYYTNDNKIRFYLGKFILLTVLRSELPAAILLGKNKLSIGPSTMCICSCKFTRSRP